MTLPILSVPVNKKIRFLDRIRARLMQKPRPRCAKCGSPFFSESIEVVNGRKAAYCLICHTLNVFDREIPQPK